MADDPLIGTEIAGRFRITRRLGEGSVGEVYLAEHALLGRSFAIKLLKRDFRSNPTVTERFRREALVASRLDHRNIVTISDFGTSADGRLYLVMEYVDGPSLGRAIEERLPGVMPLRRAMMLLGQIARGMSAAHDAGVIHRDLKPENLLIASTRTGEVLKILDFGLAKLMVDAESLVLTRRGQLFGTPMYMSPEQARGDELDSRADIYAFGAVAYEVLTGRSIFQTEALDELLRQIQMEMPPAPSTVQPLGSLPIPPEVDALVLACLAKDREARPLRISAVGSALERCVADLRRTSGAFVATSEYDRLELAELQQLEQEARAMSEMRASVVPGLGAGASVTSGVGAPAATTSGSEALAPDDGVGEGTSAVDPVSRVPSIQVTTFVELDPGYWRRICKAAVGLARYLDGRDLLGPEARSVLATLAEHEQGLNVLEEALEEPRRRLAMVEQAQRDREAQLRHAVIDLSLERGRVAESSEADPQQLVDLDFQIRMLEQRLAEAFRRGRLDRAEVEPPVQALEAKVEQHQADQQEEEVRLLGALRRERPDPDAVAPEVAAAFAQLEELLRGVG